MHDHHAVAYEYETLVVDDPDDPTPVPLWIDDGEVMHVRTPDLDGLRHRLKPGHQQLACGPDFDHSTAEILPEKLDGADYCERCFTDSERFDALKAVADRYGDPDLVTITPSRRKRP